MMHKRSWKSSIESLKKASTWRKSLVVFLFVLFSFTYSEIHEIMSEATAFQVCSEKNQNSQCCDALYRYRPGTNIWRRFIRPTDRVGKNKCAKTALSWRNEGVNTLSLGKVLVCWVVKEEETNANIVVLIVHVLQS